MVFSKVLEYDLNRYLRYAQRVESTIPGSCLLKQRGKEQVIAEIAKNNEELSIRFSNDCFERQYALEEDSPYKTICSLIWMNTRNKFSLHILKSLLDYQKPYWLSGKESDIKPLTLKRFLSLYPQQYLDASRLSRLLPNFKVRNPQDRVINLRSLFISKKKNHSFLIRDIINSSERQLKDGDIQDILQQRGILLTKRTICNCRKLLGIQNYRIRKEGNYTNYPFGDYLSLTKKQRKKIPPEPGVYELSVSAKIDYPKQSSNVVYIGISKNLRGRISDYLGSAIKNARLKKFIENYETRVRYLLTVNYIPHERHLLNRFIMQYGELPKANRVGGKA